MAKGQKDYNQAQANQQNLPLQLQPLHNAMALLRTNPDLQTGAGQAQWAHAITSIAAALNISVPQGSSDLQELTKYLVQNVRAQETGGSTDLDRLQTEAANPNPTTQSRDALQVLLAKQIGVTRLQSAALDYFNSKYPDAQTAATNSGRFNIDTTDWKKKQDPTAWAADDLAPDQVARYFNGLNGTYDPRTHVVTGDKQVFINSLRDARQIGHVAAGSTAAPATEPPPLPAGVP